MNFAGYARTAIFQSMLTRWLFAVFALYILVLPLAAQDIDSIVTVGNRSVHSIAAEIHDPTERAAFLSLYKTKTPEEMQKLSQVFLQRYPRSAFLPTVYEFAARSSFDLGNYSAGLAYARSSLALWPENPLLLVAVADVQARTKQSQEALENAQNSLQYLKQLMRPLSIAEKNWPHIRDTHEATAWFVIGRVQLLQALAKPKESAQSSQLAQAEASLIQACTLNPENPEIRFLLGLTYLAEHKVSSATVEFANVYKEGGGFAPKASAELFAIYKSKNPSRHLMVSEADIDAFVSKEEKERPAVSRVSAVDEPATRLPGYAGSDACDDCHSDIYDAWRQTGMAKMLRPYKPQNVMGDFVKNNEFYAGDEITYREGKLRITQGPHRKLFARMIIRKGRHYFEIMESDGRWRTFPVDYTIGSKWQQAYATTLPNGEIHVFPIEYNKIQRRWVDYWKVIDSPGSERANPYNWEKLDASTSYKENCAVCHTSQLRGENGNTDDPKHFIFREPGINCEMCHGPSAAHIAAVDRGEISKGGSAGLPVDFNRIGNREFVAICAQCHMQSNLHTASKQGEMNYSSTGKFFLVNRSLPLDEFSRKAFYKDGRFSKTTFIVEALQRSACFRKGKVSCGTCHDPHGHDSASNVNSLKFRNDPDRMCTGCHTQFKTAANQIAHTHHLYRSEASRCVSCHMPKIVDGLLFRARTHQIDDIPNAQMTERFGQADSPNACLLCHKEKTAKWVQNSLTAWNAANETHSPSHVQSAEK